MNNRIFLILLFLLALVLRLAVAFSIPRDRAMFPDSHEYMDIAKNIVEGKGIISDEQHKLSRPPIYPLFLAGHILIFGDTLLPIQITQSILGALAVLFIFALVIEIFNNLTVAKISATVVAVYPYFLYFACLILYETLFIFLLSLAILLLVHGVRRSKLWVVLFSGFIIGLIPLMYAGNLGFWLFMTPAIVFYARKCGTTLNMKKTVILFVIVVFIPLIPWTIRNYLISGKLIPVSLQGGYALCDAFAPGADGGGDARKLHKWLEEVKDLPELEQDKALYDKAVKVIIDDPFRATLLAFNKLAYFYNPIPKAEGYTTTFYKLVGFTSSFPVILFAIFGICYLRKEIATAILIFTPILYYSLLHTVFVSSIRYRIPIEPLLIILAGYGFYILLIKRRVSAKQ